MKLRSWPLSSFVALCFLVACVVVACGAYDPTSESHSNSDIGSDIELGTESGNPAEAAIVDMELGTESGNPGFEDPIDLENGTESGNPTRPPPTSTDPSVQSPDISVPETPTTEGSTNMPGDGAPTVPSDSETDGMATPGTAGSPAGNPGAMCDASVCAMQAQAAAAEFGAARPAPAAYDTALCSADGLCACSNEMEQADLYESADDVCLVEGRTSCLYSSLDYSGCDVVNPATCESACEEVFQAKLEDAAVMELSVRASACGSSGCRYVLVSADGACLLGGDARSPGVVDCAKSDEELLHTP